MKAPQPPKWADRFLRWFCSPEQVEILQGDLHELYHERLSRGGRSKANLIFIAEVFDLLRPFAIKRKRTRKINSTDMLRNYLIVAIRNIRNQKIYSGINITGLAIGLACFILVSLYILDELSYDRMHSKADRIYRLTEKFESDGVGEHSASQPFPVGPTLVNDFPSLVEKSVRLFNFQSPTLALANRKLDKEFNESSIFFADSTFLDVFDFEMLAGNKETALDEPNSILITRSMAKKYFDDDDPMGQILEFQGAENYAVTGILEDAPLNAHFQFDFIISFSSLKNIYGGRYPRTWYWNPCWTYVVLPQNTAPETFHDQMPGFIDKYFPDFIKEDLTLILQPLTDIHLHSKLDYEIQANGNSNNVYIFSGVAILVLLIAVINFINLSTARASKRAKEVGIRKTLGSSKGKLVNQFILESVMYTFFAVVLSLVIVFLTLPYFNQLAEKSISLITLLTPTYIISLFGLIILVGLSSGFYPAFVLSSFSTISVLKNSHLKIRGFGFRRVLVAAQFVISMMLIVSTIIAISQLQYLQDDDLGFNKEHVIMIPVIRSPMGQHYKSFKAEAMKSPDIISMTAVEEIVGAKHQVANYQFGEMERSKPFPHFQMRHDFVRTFNIPMAAGRAYDENILSDDSAALVINEALVRNLGWEDAESAIGKPVKFGSRPNGRVVGVVKDYNFVSKHHPIAPLVLQLNLHSRAFELFIKYVAVRVQAENTQAAIDHLDQTWKKFIPNRPFDFFFLDDKLNDSYRAEQKLTKVTIAFSMLAILVACLGLFGLATYSVEQRTKEIGVRKVLGISPGDIMWLLSKEFLIIIAISILISTPLSYFLLNEWLNGFAYRVAITLWPFLIAGFTTLIVAIATVSYHAFRASHINPVEVLKYE